MSCRSSRITSQVVRAVSWAWLSPALPSLCQFDFMDDLTFPVTYSLLPQPKAAFKMLPVALCFDYLVFIGSLGLRGHRQVIDGERQVKNRKWHAHSYTADKTAEPTAEPSFLDPVSRSFHWLWLTVHCTIQKGNEASQVTEETPSCVGSCSLLDRDIRTLAYREACHPCKTDLNSKNYSGWISQPQQTLWQEGFITADHHK